MAINIKEMFGDTLLELVNTKKLEKITVNDLISKTGASRQTFYNHFCDKNDLIQWIYSHYILTAFPEHADTMFQYNLCLVDYYNRLIKYKKFMTQAIQMTCQNNLKSFMQNYLINWEKSWLENLYICKYKSSPPDNFYFIIEYHSVGCVNMVLKWIEQDFPLRPEELANHITNLRLSILKYWNMDDVLQNFQDIDIDCITVTE